MRNPYTPGPWKIHTLPNGQHHIMADHWGASVAVTMYPENGREGREANARLLAAAPDLLHALRLMLREHDALCLADGMTEDRWPAATLARAVIAQAGGDA